MLYTPNPHLDYNNLGYFINEYTKGLKLKNILVDGGALMAVCYGIREEFPHVAGMNKASAFKKMANFISHFLDQKPIKSSFPSLEIPGAPEYDPNAVVALEIAIHCLENSVIIQQDGSEKKIAEPIYISDHSYGDIIDALSSGNICPKQHYKFIAVLLEQIVYKTNRGCEYPPVETHVFKGDGKEEAVPGLYETPYTYPVVPPGDDDEPWGGG